MKKIASTILISTCLLLIFRGIAFSQATTGSASVQSSDSTIIYVVIGILVIVLLFQTFLVTRLVRYIVELNYKLNHGTEMPLKVVTGAPEVAPEQVERIGSRVWKSLTRPVPKGKVKDEMLDHNYDGIQELDNRMPPWLQLIFYTTIAFAVLYLMVFHVFHTGKLPREEYAAELKHAAEMKEEMLKRVAAAVDESTVKQLTDAQTLNIGKSIFIGKCSPCHGMNGEGNVGPNLTDDFWIHGGSVTDIFKIVKYGAPAKGMISWQATLQPHEMQDVVSFIMSLHGSNPANAKAAQGELYSPPKAPLSADSAGIVPPTIKSSL